MQRPLLITLFICLVHTVLWGQYTFSGTVTDEKQSGLSGAQVLLSHHDSIYAVSLTDKDGKFSIRKVVRGIYEMQIIYPGYTAFEDQREVKSNQNYTFSLLPELKANLENVEVYADVSEYVKRTATGYIYKLSQKGKESGDPYRALSEIPRLVVNEVNREVKMTDGSRPLVLINGISVNTGITPIDPQNIESVEIIDVINARYLRTGVRHILNVKLKEKRNPYQFFEVATRHEIPWCKGMGVVYFEVGNSYVSLFGRGSAEYVHNNDTELTGWQQGETYFKKSFSNSRVNGHSYLGELLLKWKVSKNDYMAFHVYTTNRKSDTDSWGNGFFETDQQSSFTYDAFSKDKSNILTSSVYHRHTFPNNSLFETTLAYNGNWNLNAGKRLEAYPNYIYSNLFDYDNHRSSASLNLDYSLDLSSGSSFNVGNEIRFVNDKIDETTDLDPLFHHREWSQYLYVGYSGKIQNLRYMLSAGLEAFWLKAGGKSASYIRPRTSLSGTYSFNDNNSLRVNYTLTNAAPSVGQLNPYNTSTDSLVVSVGNPGLTPQQIHRTELSYMFNYKKITISPDVKYEHHTNVIEPFGYSKNDIFINTFRNQGRFRHLSLGGSVSYRLGNVGSVYVYADHKIDYFDGQKPRPYFGCGGGFTVNYKKWYVGGDVNYINRTYTAISTIKSRMFDYSQIQVNYTFFKGFYVALALQYLHQPKVTEEWTNGSRYNSYTHRTFKDQGFRPWVLLRYTFRSNQKRKIKLGNVVSGRESGIELKK